MIGLSEAQRDGIACVRCGAERGAMVPHGRSGDVQMFAHEHCVEEGRAERDSTSPGARAAAAVLALTGVLSQRVGSTAAWSFAADVAQVVSARKQRGEVVAVADVIADSLRSMRSAWTGTAWAALTDADVEAFAARGAQAWERALRERSAA